jgi:hypothetical protein
MWAWMTRRLPWLGLSVALGVRLGETLGVALAVGEMLGVGLTE